MQSLWADPDRLGLVTDLYQLTMAAAYDAADLAGQRATFEMFVRRLPPERGYLVAAGLEQALHYLTTVGFQQDDIAYLRSLATFRHVPESFFERLACFRFTGDVWAVPEGTVIFAGEPLLRVTGPLIEAQIVETYLLATLGYQTLVATKAARVVEAARDRAVVDFGSRRAHGPQAGLLAARATFIGGCTGTSNVLAGRLLDIPVVGTQAHSWVMAFDRERDAFTRYADVFPETAVMLIDTYNVEDGARKAAAALGERLTGVRLDSGDLAEGSRRVRAILDAEGAPQAKIFASSDLDEYSVDELTRQDVPIDAFGVGTAMVTSLDAAALGVVYKLVERGSGKERVGRVKLSPGKATYPGRKQVFRTAAPDGTFREDVVGLAEEVLAGEPLLRQVLDGGAMVEPLPTLVEIQGRCRAQLARLPEVFHRFRGPAEYPVRRSERLEQAAREAAH